MKTYKITPHLSENNLGEVLTEIFGIVPESQTRIKVHNNTLVVDYTLKMPHNEQLVYIEFNGPTHYTRSKTITRDYALREHCVANGIRLVEIPYFVQLSDYTIEQFFGEDVYDVYLKGRLEITSDISSGFISKNIILPYDFNVVGLSRYNEDIQPISQVKGVYQKDGGEYWITSREIFKSLYSRSNAEINLLESMLPILKNISTITQSFIIYPS